MTAALPWVKPLLEEAAMCLAVPMRVVEVKNGANDLLPPTALVELEGLSQEVRLDIVDRLPEVDDFVIVHAGFAIHAMSATEARKNIDLMREMAEGLM